MATCDYCGREFEEGEGDMNFFGVDFCCIDCMEDICDICGSGISPATSENFVGRCSHCDINIKYEED